MATMVTTLRRALNSATWLFQSATTSPVHALLSAFGLWYAGMLIMGRIRGAGVESSIRACPQPKGAHLLTIPQEIRDMILTRLLISEAVIKPYNLTTPLSPTLLQTCRQINAEGSFMLYTKNVFHLDDPMLAVQFLSWDCRASRSLISELTIFFASSPTVLHRNDHPAQGHVAPGQQPSYRDLRELATSMHQWSVALSNIPAGIQALAVFPYSFFECCNHIQHAWPLTSTWFCPGCGLQQFSKDNKLENFLPASTTRRVFWEQGPQMVIAYEFDSNRNLRYEELRRRQGHLFAVAKGRVRQIRNG